MDKYSRKHLMYTGNPHLIATGGTETTCGDYKIHVFTGPGTFTVFLRLLLKTWFLVEVFGGGAGGILSGLWWRRSGR